MTDMQQCRNIHAMVNPSRRKIMKKSYSIVFIVAIIAGIAGLVNAGMNMQEGKWEMTIITEMKGMPYPMPPMKYMQCLTKKDMNPQKRDKNQECREISSRVNGNTYNWVIECSSKEGKTRSSGTITYHGSTFSGVVDTMSQGMAIKQKMSGRRIGACD